MVKEDVKKLKEQLESMEMSLLMSDLSSSDTQYKHEQRQINDLRTHIRHLESGMTKEECDALNNEIDELTEVNINLAQTIKDNRNFTLKRFDDKFYQYVGGLNDDIDEVNNKIDRIIESAEEFTRSIMQKKKNLKEKVNQFCNGEK